MAKPSPAEIEQRVEDWHNGLFLADDLHEALGWTPEEYAAWTRDAATAPDRRLPDQHDIALSE